MSSQSAPGSPNRIPTLPASTFERGDVAVDIEERRQTLGDASKQDVGGERLVGADSRSGGADVLGTRTLRTLSGLERH